MASFDDSVTAILISQPFYGELLMRYQHVATDQLPTAAVSRTELMYNPAFWESLSDDEGIFVLTHEIQHVVLQHLDDLKYGIDSGIGPDGKMFDTDRMNRAMDYVVNDFLKTHNIGAMPAMALHSPNFPHTMTPMQVYRQLPPSDPKTGKGTGQGPMDEHKSDAPADGKQDAVTGADIVSAAENAKAMGKLPAGIERLIEGLRKPTASPWARLRKQVMSAISGNDTATWRRMQRRLITRGIGAPSRIGFGCDHVAVVVDTSGSIGKETLELFFGHMAAILTDARPRKISVLWVDAAVGRIDTVKTGGELRTLMRKKVPGGGGTNMQVGVDKGVDLGANVVVVLTDMYTPFGDKPKGVPVIWASITEGMKAPYGETIYIH